MRLTLLGPLWWQVATCKQGLYTTGAGRGARKGVQAAAAAAASCKIQDAAYFACYDNRTDMQWCSSVCSCTHRCFCAAAACRNLYCPARSIPHVIDSPYPLNSLGDAALTRLSSEQPQAGAVFTGGDRSDWATTYDVGNWRGGHIDGGHLNKYVDWWGGIGTLPRS